MHGFTFVETVSHLLKKATLRSKFRGSENIGAIFMHDLNEDDDVEERTNNHKCRQVLQ